MPATTATSRTAAPKSRWERLLALLGLQGLYMPGRKRSDTTKRPPATLAIADIPERIAALPIRMNTALTGPDDTHFRRWQRQLLRSLLSSAPRVFVMADTPRAMEKLLAVPDLQEALAQGRIQPWILSLDAQAHIARNRLPELLSELHAAGLRPQHALLCTNGAGLLQRTRLSHLERMSSQWLHWARQRAAASVWCFTVESGHPSVRPILSALARCFLYAAHLEVTATEPALMLERWDSPQGALFHTRYGLEPTASGLLRASGSIVRGSVARLAQAPDAQAIYVTQACMHNLHVLPPHWKVVKDWPAMEQASRNAIGATLLLDAGMPEQFEALAALVHQLRSSHPPTLKIAVLETRSALRSHHEQALLQLGANEVFYAEMRMARIVRHVQELRDQVFQLDIPTDWEAMLADFLPVPERGYQPPRLFIGLVRSMLPSAQRQNLTHALVRLQLLPHVSHSMAIKAYCGTRAGDLLTADAHSLWLFLYTCREVDVEPTLERLFSTATANLFSSQTIHSQLPGIAQQMDLLQEADGLHPLPDYSPLQDEQGPPAALALPPVAPIAAGSVPMHTKAPAPAQPSSTPFAPPTPTVSLTWQAHPLGASPHRPERAP